MLDDILFVCREKWWLKRKFKKRKNQGLIVGNLSRNTQKIKGIKPGSVG
jgi:hypothetical protein